MVASVSPAIATEIMMVITYRIVYLKLKTMMKTSNAIGAVKTIKSALP